MHTAEMAEHFEQVDEAKMQEGGENFFTVADVQNNAAIVLPKIGAIYQTVRPFLLWASKFVLIPKKVKNVIKAFMALMDNVAG